jgi:hypothetical protein
MSGAGAFKARGGPRLWPIALLLSVLIWVIATTDGRHVFVKEVLGDAFDSQAEHFLRGNVNVDGEAIRWEAMIVNGQSRMYFGPFPALLRIPLNLIYPEGRGAWSRISGFLAGELALFAFAGLISTALRASPLSLRAQNWLGGACLVGFVFATPLLFLLGNLSIYNEAIIWALAWSIAALFFAWRCRNAGARVAIIPFAGFSLCSAAALLSRLTYGAPLVLIAGLMILQLILEKRFRLLAPLLIPLGIGIACYLFLSYARFGNFAGLNYDDYINPVHREFAHKYGVFQLARLPYSAADYFGLRFPAFQSQAPFLRADRHPYFHPRFYSTPVSETYLPVTWTATWLLAGAIGGIVCLFQKNGADLFERGTAAAFACQSIGILSFYALSQRYSVDLYPFLIFCFLLFLRDGRRWLQPSAPVLIALVVLSGIVNSLATVSWLVGADQNVRPETHAIYDRFLGRSN